MPSRIESVANGALHFDWDNKTQLQGAVLVKRLVLEINIQNMNTRQISRASGDRVKLPSTVQRCYVKPFQRPQQRQLKRRQFLLRAEGIKALCCFSLGRCVGPSRISALHVHADEDGFQDKIKKLKDAQKKDDAASSENGKKGKGINEVADVGVPTPQSQS